MEGVKLIFQVVSTSVLALAIIMEWVAYRSYKKVEIFKYESQMLQSIIFYVLALITKMVVSVLSAIEGKYWSASISVVTVALIVAILVRSIKVYKKCQIHYQCKWIDEGLDRIVQAFLESGVRPVDITSTCNYSENDPHVRFIYNIIDNSNQSNQFILYMDPEVYKHQTEGLVDLTMRLYSKMKDAGLVEEYCIRKHEVTANEEV